MFGLDSLGAKIILEDKQFFRVKCELVVKGENEAVTFHPGIGWLTEKELFDMRQTDPRMAP